MESPGEVYEAEKGTLPSRLRDGAVVGPDTAERLNIEPGSKITVGATEYRVRAILEREGELSPVAPNDIVIIPQREFGAETYSQVIVSLQGEQRSYEVASSIESELNARNDQVSILQLSTLSEGVDELFNTIQQFLLAVGFMSLLVASICILNVMLMSAIQRREEIGVIRAVGVGRVDVLKILLTEAVLLGLGGSLLGVIVAVALGTLVNWLFLGNALAVVSMTNLVYSLMGILVGTGICTLSGLIPAWIAANERPAAAIHG